MRNVVHRCDFRSVAEKAAHSPPPCNLHPQSGQYVASSMYSAVHPHSEQAVRPSLSTMRWPVRSLVHLLPSPSSTTTSAVERYGRCCSPVLVIDDLRSTVGAVLKLNVVGPLTAAFLANERALRWWLNQIGNAPHHATPARILSACNPGKRALQALAIQRIIRHTAQLIGNCTPVIRRHWQSPFRSEGNVSASSP